MKRQIGQRILYLTLILLATLAFTGLVACSSASKTPGGTTVVNSDSMVTAKIEAIRNQTSGYPWEVSVLIESTTDVDSLPNPTKDSLYKVIIVKTDLDMSTFKVGNLITAKIKYAGDVPKPGIILYMYNIALDTHQ